MARIYTYAEIRAKAAVDLDVQSESFITADEMAGYANEAIDEAEALIHNMYEDYFLVSRENFALTTGVSEYDLPAAIYGNKIRRFIYHKGTELYTIRRIREMNEFEIMEEIDQYGLTDDYQYIIINKVFTDITSASTGGYKILLFPTSRETSTTNVKISYIRNANRVPLPSTTTQALSDATLIDIPEFYTFVIQFMKVKLYEKEGDARQTEARIDLEGQRRTMIETLTGMVPDTDSTIKPDFTHYQEHS